MTEGVREERSGKNRKIKMQKKENQLVNIDRRYTDTKREKKCRKRKLKWMKRERERERRTTIKIQQSQLQFYNGVNVLLAFYRFPDRGTIKNSLGKRHKEGMFQTKNSK